MPRRRIFLFYPAVNLPPSHSRQRHRKPTGYHMTPPSSLHRSYKSYKSYASVTPTQHAYRRCHQKSPAYPCGKSTTEPCQTAAPQTHGVSHGLPRRSPSGRRRAHPSCQTGQTGQTGQTQAPHPRPPHTAVAIKKARHTSTAHRRPSHSRLRHRKPTGYTAAHHYPLVTVNHR